MRAMNLTNFLKQTDVLTSYKDAYPRRSAFREEMREYGWIDTKRK